MLTVFEILKELVSFGPVVPNTPTHTKIVNYIQSWYERIGWASYVQGFKSSGIPFSNVICTPKCDIRTPITIIGAHFDTMPETDAANDNKSATAVVLHVADRLAEEGCDNILTVHFDGEEEIGSRKEYIELDEQGKLCFNSMFYGSMYFVQKVAGGGIALEDFLLTREKIEKSIIIDMCGAKDADHVLSVAGDQRVMRLVYNTARKLGLENAISKYLLDGWSDQTAFLSYSIPTVLMADLYKKPLRGPPSLRVYTIRHTKEDSIDKIDPEKMEKIEEIVYRAARTHM